MAMTKEELQKKIDRKEKSVKEMREIGESYLSGDVLRDYVAAEGWLQKVVDAEDAIESSIAMSLIAKKILGKEQVISDADYLVIKKELENAGDEKRPELEQLLSIATEKQKKL